MKALLVRLPLFALLLAASCPPKEEDTLSLLETAYRRIQRGQIEEGVAAFARSVERIERMPPEVGQRLAWVRAFVTYMLHKAGGWERVDAHVRDRRHEWESLQDSLSVRGPETRLADWARETLLESRFHEEGGHWGRLPAWAMAELLQLCGDGLLQRAQSSETVLESIVEDVPARWVDLLAREALARAACRFQVRAWEAAIEQRAAERDSRMRFAAAARLLSVLHGEIGALSSDPAYRSQRVAESARWEQQAAEAEERTPLAVLGVASDQEFVDATVRDHFEAGVKAYGAAIEEVSGRGLRERAEARYREALAHLLTAREFTGIPTKEEAARLECVEDAVREVHRIAKGE